MFFEINLSVLVVCAFGASTYAHSLPETVDTCPNVRDFGVVTTQIGRTHAVTTIAVIAATAEVRVRSFDGLVDTTIFEMCDSKTESHWVGLDFLNF